MINSKISEKSKGIWDVEHTYEELDLHLVVKKSSDHYVDYEVRALTLFDDGKGPAFKFIDKNTLDPTTDFDRGDVLVKGTIKWDGCSHNNFGDKGYLHGCSRHDLTRFSTLFNRLFDIAIDLIGNESYLK